MQKVTHKVGVVGVRSEREGGVRRVTLCQIRGEVPEFAVCSILGGVNVSCVLSMGRTNIEFL